MLFEEYKSDIPYCLFGAKPMLANCQLDSLVQIPVECKSNSKISIQENEFQTAVYKISTILSRLQCVKEVLISADLIDAIPEVLHMIIEETSFNLDHLDQLRYFPLWGKENIHENIWHSWSYACKNLWWYPTTKPTNWSMSQAQLGD